MPQLHVQRAAQRAIFFVQRELERAADASNAAIVLCERRTVDSAAYWPGPEVLWALEEQLARYEAVIHLRTPTSDGGYNHRNPLRTESAGEAAAIDARIVRAWEHHPRRFVIDACPEFIEKATRALEILRDEVPTCCKQHLVAAIDVVPTMMSASRS
jgi:hypothetical protein